MFERHAQLLGTCLEKLFQAKVLVAGVGGLGCTVSSLLVRMGVGQIHLLDKGVVDEPDLNRQILYDEFDLGRKKVAVAKEKLSRLGSYAKIFDLDLNLDFDFCLPNVDVVVDCLDSFEAKFALDSLCERKGVPLVHAGVQGFCGQVSTILPGSVRLKRLFRTVPKEETIRQVYPPLVSLIASLQVHEVIKLLCDEEPNLVGKIFLVDLSSMRFEVIKLEGVKQ
ncbi:HesA/MoeB/ThiF family protein [Pseudothermotoga sp.]|uniref:HesA/MoeB/ThiF family protein n=1 Tax=Pseudothermotoga sp. TaxID=2033661 RepID=UPI0031F68CA0